MSTHESRVAPFRLYWIGARAAGADAFARAERHWERFGRAILPLRIEAAVPDHTNGYCAEAARRQSHLRALREYVRSDAPYGIVVESDRVDYASADQWIGPSLHHVLRGAPDDWDLVVLGGAEASRVRARQHGARVRWCPSRDARRMDALAQRFDRWNGADYVTSCYAVRRRAAERVLAAATARAPPPRLHAYRLRHPLYDVGGTNAAYRQWRRARLLDLEARARRPSRRGA
jgi:hypothetical protein